jgi:hypothetical protein
VINALKETEVKIFLEKITSMKLTNIDALLQHLSQIEKFMESDRIFACEFYAKGGKKVIVDYIRDGNKLSDPRKWFVLKQNY